MRYFRENGKNYCLTGSRCCHVRGYIGFHNDGKQKTKLNPIKSPSLESSPLSMTHNQCISAQQLVKESYRNRGIFLYKILGRLLLLLQHR